MSVSLFAYSKKGIGTARRIAAALEGPTALYTVERLAGEGLLPIPKPSAPFFGKRFSNDDALIFVSSCGIAVRSIAPHIRSKTEDPAVIVIDETGRFVISLLSGHIGGANALAERIADALGATAVITTATDASGRFSVDSWAKANGFSIRDMGMAKAVSAAILEGDIPLKSDFPIIGKLPAGLKTGEGETGVYVTYKTDEPYKNTLRIIPKCLRLGIGCRRGIAREAVKNAVDTVLFNNGIDPLAVKCAASIDLKRDEAGLLEYCLEAGLPTEFFSAERLNGVQEAVSSSEFVKSVTGVDCVCERAALVGADRLIVKKTAINGVTVAVSLEKTEVSFG
ncbi:MAG: cobalt-precorrin 5A hydrolase [Clostridia bacterium]|nr:cobalt-precorrin 5A hydrolase [Clostridia bacterium]